jgi:hypothetical protein
MSRRTQESIAHSKHARSEQEEEEEARSEYLSELLKLASGSSSQRVQKEPEKQKLDQGRLERRLLECAQKHYKAFIKADFAKDEIEQRSSEFERTLVQCKKDFELMKKRVLEFASQGERCERQRALLLGLNVLCCFCFWRVRCARACVCVCVCVLMDSFTRCDRWFARPVFATFAGHALSIYLSIYMCLLYELTL